MKTKNLLIQNAQRAVQRAQTGQADSVHASFSSCEKDLNDTDQRVAAVIDRLFESLKSIYSTSFQSTFKTSGDITAAKLQFRKAFSESGVRSVAQIERGLSVCRSSGSPFLPSVGQFVRYCIDSDHDDSFERMLRRQLDGTVELTTAQEVAYQCRNSLAEKDARKLWFDTLGKNRMKYARGEIEDTPVSNRVAPPPPKQAGEEQLKQQIEELTKKGYPLLGSLKKKAKEMGVLNAD